MFRSTITRSTTDNTDILDLTGDVQRVARESAIEEGTVLVFAPGATAGITTLEFESGAIEDLKRAIERMAPRSIEYEHDRRWGDGNGYSHVRAALMGPSLAIPVSSGAPMLGTW